MHGVKEVVETKIHTAGLLAPEPSASDFEQSIDKIKSNKSPGIVYISAEIFIKTN